MSGGSSTPALAFMLLAASQAGATTRDAMHDQPIVEACIRLTTGNRSWLEKTLWGLYDQERGWPGAQVANRNGSFDLGPMQVNSIWVSPIAIRLRRSDRDVWRWIRNDACFNIGVAAWLFVSGLSRQHDYWGAIGSYHSPTHWRGRHYALQVASRLRRRYGPGVFTGR